LDGHGAQEKNLALKGPSGVKVKEILALFVVNQISQGQ
jgi:hypothetical protein